MEDFREKADALISASKHTQDKTKLEDIRTKLDDLDTSILTYIRKMKKLEHDVSEPRSLRIEIEKHMQRISDIVDDSTYGDNEEEKRMSGTIISAYHEDDRDKISDFLDRVVIAFNEAGFECEAEYVKSSYYVATDEVDIFYKIKCDQTVTEKYHDGKVTFMVSKKLGESELIPWRENYSSITVRKK